MGRWSQYDEDDYRLPDGMKRVGYDADSGKYLYRNKGGSLWEGQEGAQFGELTRGPDVPTAAHDGNDDDVEIGPTREGGYALVAGDANGTTPYPRYATGSPYRMLFPFFLIVIVVLLLVWRLVVSPGLTPEKYPRCPEGSSRVTVVAGDTCWKIAKAHGCGLEALRKVNGSLRCERLMPGDQICVPVEGDGA
ncbi:hypothetical protein BC834DRAFT_442492 [Gloeopeniophorella convolvens]|nr:hypothetical protein BC834DRAFT_442492 [Gloeopeniophorella convolvens]